jgi:hypothetical protein
MEGKNQALIRPIALLAVSYAEMHYFGSEVLNEVMEEYPAERPHVQRRILWCSVFLRVRHAAASRIAEDKLRETRKKSAGDNSPVWKGVFNISDHARTVHSGVKELHSMAIPQSSPEVRTMRTSHKLVRGSSKKSAGISETASCIY